MFPGSYAMISSGGLEIEIEQCCRLLLTADLRCMHAELSFLSCCKSYNNMHI